MIRLCSSSEIPAGEGRVVVAGGTRLALFRTRGGWRAVQAACPHRGGPLADGIVADASVTCPLHQRRFSLETGEPLGHDCRALTVYALSEQDGELYVAPAAVGAAVAD